MTNSCILYASSSRRRCSTLSSMWMSECSLYSLCFIPARLLSLPSLCCEPFCEPHTSPLTGNIGESGSGGTLALYSQGLYVFSVEGFSVKSFSRCYLSVSLYTPPRSGQLHFHFEWYSLLCIPQFKEFQMGDVIVRC